MAPMRDGDVIHVASQSGPARSCVKERGTMPARLTSPEWQPCPQGYCRQPDSAVSRRYRYRRRRTQTNSPLTRLGRCSIRRGIVDVIGVESGADRVRRSETVGSKPVLAGNFRQDNGAGCLQAGDDRRVPLRYGCAKGLECGSCRKPSNIDEILHHNRNSVQRGAPPLGLALGVQCARFFQRPRDSSVITEFIFGPFLS